MHTYTQKDVKNDPQTSIELEKKAGIVNESIAGEVLKKRQKINFRT